MKLIFLVQTNKKIKKANECINLIKKINLSLPHSSFITSSIRPHIDYGGIIYDQPNNASFSTKIESIQYNVVLAITGAIKGTSRYKLHQELVAESLNGRR